MDPRVQHALTVLARVTGGDPSRPIPVQALGLVFGTHDYTGRAVPAWDPAACAVYSVNTILDARTEAYFDAGRSECLGLVEAILDSPAATGQPFVFAGPLTHYLTHGTADLYDKNQAGNMRLPTAVPVGGRWLITNGTHRYAAATLLGEPVRLLLVTEPPGCRCPVRHTMAERTPLVPHTYLA